MSKELLTKDIGDISEAMVAAALLKLGKNLLKPIGDNRRYDLLIDDGGSYHRVQCKTGRLKDGVILFPVASCSGRRGVGRQSYRNQAEYFGVYCPETNEVYLVPVSEVGLNAAKLRVDPPKNGQTYNIRWAKDYKIM